MRDKQITVIDLLNPEIIRELAQPANLHYGQAIYDRGGVEFIEYGPSKVEGWVGSLNGSVAEGGSQRRRTQLFATPEGLGWHCAGNPKKYQIFCKHWCGFSPRNLRQISKAPRILKRYHHLQ